MSVKDVLENPDVFAAAATLAAFAPAPEGPMLAAALRLAEAALRAKMTADELDAITAKYSAQAQEIADKW